MTDEEVAIYILALEEGETDAKSTDSWIEHFAKQFRGWGTEVHSGDCTKCPWSCVRCIHDDTMARVPEFRRLFNITVTSPES